jgi:hypothetical protein
MGWRGNGVVDHHLAAVLACTAAWFWPAAVGILVMLAVVCRTTAVYAARHCRHITRAFRGN